jgi:hypothetical protein
VPFRWIVGRVGSVMLTVVMAGEWLARIRSGRAVVGQAAARRRLVSSIP